MSVDIAKRRILQKTSLAAIVGEVLTLTTKSGRPTGLCPFHDEKSPSFTIYDDHYYCFGCKAHGDAIDFVRHQRGLGFIEALRYLAERCSDDAPELEESRRDRQARFEDANLFRALAIAQTHFTQQLRSAAGEAARAYLRQRGFDDSTWETFGFGLALDQPFSLVNALMSQGIQGKDAVDASLASLSQKSGRPYDFFQHRLMIPIQDKHGRIIAFGGRTMGDDPAKYKNSRETRLYDKSQVLFGLHLAKDVMRKKRRVIVVEGYMDALQLMNHGFGETVACLGTALTLPHLRTLAALCDTVYLCFDGDRAGQEASLRTVSHALEVSSLAVKVVALPAGADPDDFVNAQGAAAFEGLLAESEGLLEHAIGQRLAGTHDLAIPDLIRQEFLPWLETVRDPVQKAFLVNRIAAIARMDVKDLKVSLDMVARQAKAAPVKKIEPMARAVAEPETVRFMMPKALERQDYELMAHLYFSVPQEVDVDVVSEFLAKEATIDDIWVGLGLEFCESLRQGQSPASMALAHWKSAANPHALETIVRLSRDAEAFRVEDRGRKAMILLRQLRIKGIRSTINSLKSQLVGAASSDAQRDILRAIQTLTSDIVRLEKGG